MFEVITPSNVEAAKSNLFWYKYTLPKSAWAANFVILPFSFWTAGSAAIAAVKSVSICLYTSALGALFKDLESEREKEEEEKEEKQEEGEEKQEEYVYQPNSPDYVPNSPDYVPNSPEYKPNSP